MPPLITAAQAQARGVGLALSEAVLQAIIDDEEALMIARYGAHGDGVTSVTEIARREGGSVFLRRRAVSVTSLTQAEYPGGTATALATSDRYTWLAEGRIELYPASTPYAARYDSGKLVTVVYVPVDDRALRRRILLELIGIATEQPVMSGGVGKVSGLGFSVDDGGGSSGVDMDAARARAGRKLEFFST